MELTRPYRLLVISRKSAKSVTFLLLILNVTKSDRICQSRSFRLEAIPVRKVANSVKHGNSVKQSKSTGFGKRHGNRSMYKNGNDTEMTGF